MTPSTSVGTIIADIIFFPRSSFPVTAVIINVFAKLAFVIKHFSPLMTYSSPSITAVVFVPPASEPAFGSVKPNAPKAFLLAKGN